MWLGVCLPSFRKLIQLRHGEVLEDKFITVIRSLFSDEGDYEHRFGHPKNVISKFSIYSRW